ncbi:MAG: hypothetical protein KDI17_16450 [Halioglobus sp.]|nr:hypothetical protein [Halioglobus sp.]
MRFLLIFVLLCATAPALAQRELTSIVVNYASAPELVTVIKPLLSAGSSVSAYQNRLVLNATPQELEKTRALLQQLDAAGQQLLVSVRTDASGASGGRGIDVDSVIRSGDTVITNGTGQRSAQSHTTVRVENYSGTRASGGNQAVRVTEGMPAYIATGVSAPVQTYAVGADGRRYYQQDYVSAATGFYATTWLAGDTVRISIDQGDNQLSGRSITTQQLQSEVTGPLGEWLPIGVIEQSDSSQSAGIGSRAQSSQGTSTRLFIKVEAVDTR